MGRGIAWVVGLALVIATPSVAQVPPDKPATTAAKPIRKTTSELAFVGRAGEKPPAPVAFTPIRKTTSELAFVGRAGEAPPAVAAFTPIRKTTGELAFVGAPK